MTFDQVTDIRRRSITAPDLRVKYLNKLRVIVGQTKPKNKGGVPIISDYDLIDATADQQYEAVCSAIGIK